MGPSCTGKKLSRHDLALQISMRFSVYVYHFMIWNWRHQTEERADVAPAADSSGSSGDSQLYLCALERSHNKNRPLRPTNNSRGKGRECAALGPSNRWQCAFSNVERREGAISRMQIDVAFFRCRINTSGTHILTTEMVLEF